MPETRHSQSLVPRPASDERHGLRAIDAATLDALSRLRPRIRAYLRRFARDRAARERLFSDVYSEVLGLDHDTDQTPDWPRVLRVLRRIARDEWRWSREVRDDCLVDRLPANGTADDSRAYRLALWMWEDNALSHLSALQRGALELHVMEGLRDSEIAASLGCSVASVRILRATAKKRLRMLIQRGVIPEPPRDEPMSMRRER